MSPRRSLRTQTDERPADVRTPRSELLRLTAEKATGVLRFGDEGAVYLTDGAITHAECSRATGLDRLVTGPGRIDQDGWHRACEAGDDGIDAVVEATGGLLSRAELEVATLVGIFDAAYFLSEILAEPGTAAGPTEPAECCEFVDGARHRLDPIWRIALPTIDRETDRRRARLNAVWPSPATDDAPVTPVDRVRRQRVILSGLQADLLLAADGHRTPCELAYELGRPAYGCVLAVRELAAAALIRTPGAVPAPRPAARRPAAQPRTGTGTQRDGTPRAGTPRTGTPRTGTQQAESRPAPALPTRPQRVRSQSPARRPPASGSASARKKPDRAAPPGTAGPGATPPDAGDPQARWAPVDEALLTRLHDALKELG